MTATTTTRTSKEVIPPTTLVEDRRNHHRDKAQILLKLSEAIEDSNQRSRRASAAASRATKDDLVLLSNDLQTQAAHLSKTRPPSPEDDASIQTTVRNVVTAVYQLREHAHLQYQMLEMKYFDLKRHAFDMEHQNRKLQLQLSHYPAGGGGSHPSLDTSSLAADASQSAQEEELTAQLQQENYDLRKQLRESCLDCRKLVQENYGLRKILLDAGVQWNRNSETEGGEQKEEDSEQMDDFEDAQEFDVIPEETQADLLLAEGNIAEDGIKQEGAETADASSKPVKGERAAHDIRTDLPDDSSLEGDFQPSMQSSAQGASLSQGTATVGEVTVNRTAAAAPLQPQASRPRTMSLDSTGTSFSTLGGSIPGARGKRGSRKSVTFAAMANKLTQERQMSANSSASSLGSYSYYATDNDSVSTMNTTNTVDHATTLREEKVQQQHDQNLALLGVGGVFVASSHSATTTDYGGAEETKENVYLRVEASSPPRRKSYSNYLLNGGVDSVSFGNKAGDSTDTPPSGTSQYQQVHHTSHFPRRHSHADALGGSGSGHSRTGDNKTSRTIKPASQAMTAKELMRKQQQQQPKQSKRRSGNSNTFHIHMSSVAPPRSAPHIQVSKEIDPVEEEKRLSTLLGGFRQASSAKPIASAGTLTPSVVRTSPSPEEASVLSTASNPKIRRPSFFRRRTNKSYKKTRDDDNESVASTKSLGFLSFRSGSKKSSTKHYSHK